MKSPLRYPGGKHRKAKALCDYFDVRKPLSEPFAGGASVGIEYLRRGGCALHLNELEPNVFSFWKTVFHGDVDALCEMMQTRPTTARYNEVKASRPETVLGRAERYLYLNRTSFSGMVVHRATPLGGFHPKKPDEIASRWAADSVIKNMRALNAVGNRVTITNENALGHILVSPAPQMFVDPPYVDEGDRLYGCLVSHSGLANVLLRTKALWVLTYNEHPVVRELYPPKCVFDEPKYEYSLTAVRENNKVKKEIILCSAGLI